MPFPVRHWIAVVLTATSGCSPTESVPFAPGGEQRRAEIALDEMLTVPETLGLVYARYQHKVPFNLYRRANPQAKEQLYKVLADPDQARFHGNVWMMLGYIGDESDVRLMEKHLHELSGPLKGGQNDCVSGMFNGLGLMCGRGVEAACALVDQMQEPGYWKDHRFRWDEQPNPNFPPFAYDSIWRLMVGYSLSRKPDLKARIQDILRAIEDSMLKERMEGILNLSLLTTHAKNMLSSENDSVEPEELELLVALFNGDLENPGPSERVTGPHESNK